MPNKKLFGSFFIKGDSKEDIAKSLEDIAKDVRSGIKNCGAEDYDFDIEPQSGGGTIYDRMRRWLMSMAGF